MRWKAKNKKTTDVSPKVVTGSGRKFSFHIDRRKAVWAIVGVIILGGVFYFWQNNSQKDQVACSDDLLTRAKLAQQSPEEFQDVAREIEDQRGYDEDPNCLYVLTTYYISVSDTANARTNLENLQAVYKKKPTSEIIFTYENKDNTVEKLDEELSAIEAINRSNVQNITVPSVEGPAE